MGKKLVQNEAERNSHVLPTRPGSVVVIMFIVECEKPRIPGRDEYVYQQFESINIGGVGGGSAGIV